MGLFISILEGPSPSKADPIIAISDPILVEILGKEISNRMASPKKEPLIMVPNRLHEELRKAASQAFRQAEEEGLL